MNREIVSDILLEQLKRLEKCAEDNPKSVEMQGGIAYAMSSLSETMVKVEPIYCGVDFGKLGEDKAVKPLAKTF